MKLLKRINRNFLLLSLPSLALSAVGIYFFLVFSLREDFDEKLLFRLESLKKVMKKGVLVSRIPPYLEIEKVESLPDTNIHFSERLIYQDREDEWEMFRELENFYTLHDINYRIVIRDSILEREDFLELVTYTIGISFLLLFLVFTFSTQILSKKIWQPFQESLHELKKLSAKQGKALVFRKSGIDEFDVLNQELSQLSQRVQTEFRSMKEFSENASHELQTPLAIIQSKLELLNQSSKLTAKELSLVASIDTAVKRLSHINQNLLLIAKIENNQFPLREKIKLKVFLTEKIEQFGELAKAKGIRVHSSLKGDIVLSLNPYLLESFINNLLSNAIKHNNETAFIRISLTQASLTVENSGFEGDIRKDDLFKRFKKGTKHSSGVGLGLTIIKEIAESFSWDLNYDIIQGIHIISVNFGASNPLQN